MMTPRPTPLFWPLSGADFTRSIKWSHTQINAVAAQILGKLSSLAPTLNRSAVAAGPITRAGEGNQFHPVPVLAEVAVGSSCNIGARLTHTSDQARESTTIKSQATFGDNSRGGVKLLAGQTCGTGRLGVGAKDNTQAASLHLGTKYLNTLIHAKPAAQSGDLDRNSADTPDRGRLGGNFPAHTKSPDQCALGSAN